MSKTNCSRGLWMTLSKLLSGFFLPIFLWPFIKLMTAAVNHPYCDGPKCWSPSLLVLLSSEWAISKICMDTHKVVATWDYSHVTRSENFYCKTYSIKISLIFNIFEILIMNAPFQRFA